MSMETNTAVPIIVKLIMSVGGQEKKAQSMFGEISCTGDWRQLTTPSDQPQCDNVMNDELGEIRARFLQAVRGERDVKAKAKKDRNPLGRRTP